MNGGFNQHQLDTFWWFGCERQRIWHRRFVQQLPPPWTDDLVLRTERFTNVYRELDPGTQYAINQILERDDPAEDRIFNIMLYRLIGRKETHQAIGFQRIAEFSGADMSRAMQAMRDAGQPPFTAAYVVSGYSSMGSRDKIENVARLFKLIAAGFQSTYRTVGAAGSAEEVHRALRDVPGFGDFLAYQVLVDLLYPLRINRGAPLLPFSQDDWAKAGPGARRGIRLLDPYQTHGYLAIMRWLRDHQAWEFDRLGLALPWLTGGDGRPVLLTLANIQNCLCEFHKYVKIRDGTGRGRRKFPAAPG